ncbi:MAG: hypothetical protein FJ134_09050 [Deltaproteobacteria bacterium]|nr:hypothetical protein [Deltaproteobacteria bacterium]
MGWFGGFTLETYNRIPGGYEEVTVGAGVAVLSSSKLKPTSGPFSRMMARAALLSLEEGDIRFRIDGSSPATSSGHYFSSGDVLVISGNQALRQFKAVKVAEANGTLRVTYFY